MTAIDRPRAVEAFKTYTDAYDATNPRIALKIEHTYHVAEACNAVAREQGWSSDDIDLIAIAHDVAKAACAPIELRGQAKIAVIGDARADEFVFHRTVNKVADACCGGCIGGILTKEDLDAQRRMAHALGIFKGVPASQLFKAAHIVEQTAKPC